MLLLLPLIDMQSSPHVTTQFLIVMSLEFQAIHRVTISIWFSSMCTMILTVGTIGVDGVPLRRGCCVHIKVRHSYVFGVCDEGMPILTLAFISPLLDEYALTRIAVVST